MVLSDKQRDVLQSMAIAAIVALIGVFGAPLMDTLPQAEPEADIGARVAFALKWDLWLVICLLGNVAVLAQHRFLTPADLDAGPQQGTAHARMLQAMLQNTLEQVVIAVLVHLIWVVSVPVSWTASVPIAAVLFTLGRVEFWRGYIDGARGRALGFGLTFYPSIVMTAALIIGAVHGFFAGL